MRSLLGVYVTKIISDSMLLFNRGKIDVKCIILSCDFNWKAIYTHNIERVCLKTLSLCKTKCQKRHTPSICYYLAIHLYYKLPTFKKCWQMKKCHYVQCGLFLCVKPTLYFEYTTVQVSYVFM